jgi:hypothetical protein
VIAAELGRRIAAADWRNDLERIGLYRALLARDGELRFEMLFAAAKQVFEFLFRAGVDLGRSSLIRSHGPSLKNPPLGGTSSDTLVAQPRPRAASCQEYLWELRGVSRRDGGAIGWRARRAAIGAAGLADSAWTL